MDNNNSTNPTNSNASAPLRVRDDNVAPDTCGDAQRVLAVRPTSPGATRRVAHLPHHCATYVDEIHDHYLSRERSLHRDAQYLSNQSDVTERMRIILVDWLVDVHLKFKLHPETFFLAVDYVDRYLMVARGSRSTLQLVGVCAMLIAAKHEEIWPPEVRDCIYISANTYSREEILSMERDIASSLNFRLCVPTPYPFATRLLNSTEATEDTYNLALYCLDIAALEYGCLRFLPSRIGYAAVLVARATVENLRRVSNAEGELFPLTSESAEASGIWTPAHSYYAKTITSDLDEILECARVILACAATINSPSSRYHAVRRKFSGDRFGDVATRYPLPATI